MVSLSLFCLCCAESSGSWRQLEHCFLQESLHCRRPEHHLPVLCSAAAERAAVLQDRQASWCHADPHLLVASSGIITEPEHLPQEQLSSSSSANVCSVPLLEVVAVAVSSGSACTVHVYARQLHSSRTVITGRS
jgi:hypothetical protein